jgi:hypothetical protein
LKFLSYPTFSGAVPENIEEQHRRADMRPRSKSRRKHMYTGRMMDAIMASVERAEEHVQRDHDLREPVLQFDDYSAFFYDVAPVMLEPAVA